MYKKCFTANRNKKLFTTRYLFYFNFVADRSISLSTLNNLEFWYILEIIFLNLISGLISTYENITIFIFFILIYFY